MKSSLLNGWRVVGLCLGIIGVALHAEESSLVQADPSVAIDPVNISNRADRIAWHREARFGMFIHYGIDCVAKTHYPGDAWQAHPVPAQEYHRYWLEFKLPQCDPDKWAKTCAEAGMQYLCFVAKHHSGFCMWDSAYTDYKVTTVTGRDIVGELAKACEKYGIKLCLYYSIADWHHPYSTYMNGGPAYILPPGVEPQFDTYVAYMKAQLKELTTKYGKIHMIWFDGGWEKHWNAARGVDLYNYTLGLQPGIICNDRVTRHSYRLINNLGDFYTPELFIAKYDRSSHWESCLKIANQWHWSPEEAGKVKSLHEVLRLLCTCAGSDGNLLLNVGPHVDGYMLPEQVERLQEVGAWMKINGEAIVGTRGGPYLPCAQIVSTCAKDVVYLHLITPIASDKLVIPALDAKVLSASLLGGPSVPFEQNHNQYTFTLPPAVTNSVLPVLKLTINKTAFDLKEVAIGETLDPKIHREPVTEANVK